MQPAYERMLHMLVCSIRSCAGYILRSYTGGVSYAGEGARRGKRDKESKERKLRKHLWIKFLVASFSLTWAGVKRIANGNHQSKNLVARCTRLDGTVGDLGWETEVYK